MVLNKVRPFTIYHLRFTLALALALFASAGMAQIKWEKDYAKALKTAKQTNKPVFIDFFAEWCGPCKMLESDVFPKPKVAALLKQVVTCRVDVDQFPKIAEQYRVQGIPRLVLLAADGKKVLWDTTGFRDADTFAEELAEALGIKPGALVKPAPSPAVEKVRESLGKGTYKNLDPAIAAKGLALLVEELGATSEAEFKPVAELVQKAGRAAIPALLGGMAHKALAVRVGSYKVIQAILSKEERAALAFDPWATTKSRATQLAAWRQKLS